jgi:hypothetical protein
MSACVVGSNGSNGHCHRTRCEFESFEQPCTLAENVAILRDMHILGRSTIQVDSPTLCTVPSDLVMAQIR